MRATQLLDTHLRNHCQIAAHYSMPLGSERFRAEIEATLGRKLGYARRGRPGVKEAGVPYG